MKESNLHQHDLLMQIRRRKSNFRLARFKLRTIKQGKDDTVDSFLKQVRVLVSECKFTNTLNTEEHITDALIFGSNNPRVQSKLLEQDATLTLDKAIDIALTRHRKLQATSSMTSGELPQMKFIIWNTHQSPFLVQPAVIEVLCMIYQTRPFVLHMAPNVRHVERPIIGSKFADLAKQKQTSSH